MKIVLIFFLSFFILLGCNQPETSHKKEEPDLKTELEAFKKTIPDTDKNPANDEWSNNLYRNRYYKFRVEFPKNWEYDQGTTKITLARALNRNYAAAISVTVKNIPEADESSNNIFENMPVDEYAKIMKEALAIQNLQPEDFEIEKGYLNNFPAYLIQFKTNQLSGNENMIYLSKQVQCNFEGKVYQLNMNIPLKMYDQKIEKEWKRVIQSYNFEIIY